MISLIVVTAFSTFGYAHDLLGDNRIPVLGREPVLLGLYLAGTLLLIVAVARGKRTFDTLLRFSTLLGTLLVVYAGARVAWAIAWSGPSKLEVPASAIRADSQPSRPPDIYMIVPDKYTGTARLAADFGFDNHGFVEALEQRGFVVPPAAQANYTHTFLAFASMLNLRYLDDLPRRFGVSNSSWRATYPMIEGNELAAFLKGRGYRFVFFPTAFGATRQNRFADLQLPSPNDIRSEMVTAWYRTTAIPALRRQACNLVPCTRAPPYVPETPEMLNWKLDRLGHLSGQGKPLFVLAHLTLPHEPYLFRSDCRVRTAYWPERDDGDEALTVKKAYIEQVACTNRKLLEVVDSILAHAPSAAGHHHSGRSRPWAPGTQAPRPGALAGGAGGGAAVGVRRVPPARRCPRGDRRLGDTGQRPPPRAPPLLRRRPAGAPRRQLLVLQRPALRLHPGALESRPLYGPHWRAHHICAHTRSRRWHWPIV